MRRTSGTLAPLAGALRAARRDPWTLGAMLASVVLVGWYLAPIWAETRTWGGTFDWGYFFFLAEVDRKTVAEYGQLPLWNPYYCGGAVHLANPQTYTLSPFNLFVILFGSPLGIRLMLTVSTLLAVDGVRRLAGSLGLDGPASWAAGTFFATSGAMAQHLGGGHIGWMGFALTPYVLWAFHRAMAGEKRFILVGAFFLAWIFLHFGVYPYPYTAVAVGAYGLLLGLVERRLGRAIGVGLVMAGLSLGLVGIRLLPLVEFIRAHPRTVFCEDYLLLSELWEVYAVRHTARRFSHHGWAWPEYGNYIGPGGVVAVGLGLLLAPTRDRWRKFLPAVVCLFVFIAFQMGNQPHFPWTYLRKLPLFENLRVPSRFTTLAGLFAAPLFGLALCRARAGARWVGGWTGRALALAAGSAAIALLAIQIDFNREQWSQTFGTPPPRDHPSPDFHQVTGSRFRMYAYPRVNRGTLSCFEESPLPRSPRLTGHASSEEYLGDPSAGTVTRVRWTPNAITLDVDLARPATVLVNQNHDPGWTASTGRVVAEDGLLGVALPAGARRLVLRYRPTSFLWGTLLSVLTAGLMGFLWWRWRPRPAAETEARTAEAVSS